MLGWILDRALGRLGYVVMRDEDFVERRGTLGWDRLRSIPLSPMTVIDVGAAEGTPELYAAFPTARLLLFEPLIEHTASLSKLLADRSGRLFSVALGSRDELRDIFVEPHHHQKTSFLERTTRSSTGDDLMSRAVQVRTVDSVLAHEIMVGPTLLKIDVEGFELEVIAGAERTLKTVDAVLIEVSIAARFKGGPQFSDMIGAMSKRGFELFDFLHIARDHRGGARHADLVFLRADRLREE